MKKIIYLLIIAPLVLLLISCTIMTADMKFTQEKYQEAIPYYQEALAASPDNIRARSRLGFAYFKTNQIDKAIIEFKKVLETDPEEPFSLLYLGMAYLNKVQYDKALATWNAYKNKKQPLIEKEIKRMQTLVKMAHSQQEAKAALANEDKLAGLRFDANTIAVGYFKDQSPDNSLQAFRKALTAMVITDLSKVEKLQVVERVMLQALLSEMELGQSGIVDNATAPRVGRLLKAEYMIVGLLDIGSIQVTSSVASASSGGIKGSNSITVAKDKFYELPSAIIQITAEILGISLSRGELEAIGAPHTKNYDAFIYYGSALDALDAGNWDKAADYFSMALQLDPAFDLAREGRDSNPGNSAPSIHEIFNLNISAINQAINDSVETVTKEQETAEEDAALGFGGGGGHHCFGAGTLVLMANGSYLAIEQIEAGDMVMGYDLISALAIPVEVKDTYASRRNHYYMLNGISVSAEQPFYVPLDRTREARNIINGDVVVGDIDGSFDTLENITIVSNQRIEEPITVYNLTVDHTNNYFVKIYSSGPAGNGPESQEKTALYLVHNKMAGDDDEGGNGGGGGGH